MPMIPTIEFLSATLTSIADYCSIEVTTPLGLSVIIIYSTFCQACRQQRYLYIQNLCSEVLDEDKNNDSCSSSSMSPYYNRYFQITALLAGNEMGLEFVLSLSTRGLLSTYGIPSISTLLYSTGGFHSDVKRRYADMTMILCEHGENQLPEPTTSTILPSADELSTSCSYDDSSRALRAIYRLNTIHSKYGNRILYQDMMYVLSVFANAAVIWAEGKWGLRPLSAVEKECLFRYWMNLGDLMNLHTRGQWQTYQDCLDYKQRYEAKYMRYVKSNQVVTYATLDYFIQGLKPAFIMQSETVKFWIIELYSVFQESDMHRIALGLPLPRARFTMFIDAIMTMRRVITSYFIMPNRLSYRLRLTSEKGHPVDRNGHDVKQSSPSCPMTMMYYPDENLENDNDSYTPYYSPSMWTLLIGRTPPKGYMIENLGPRDIEKGILTTAPKYAGVQTIKHLFD